MLGWDTNYWDFKPQRVHAPEPKARVPKPVPEPERLFQVQRHALDLLHLLAHAKVDDEVMKKAENLYRVINSYLKNNVAPSQGGTQSL